MLTRKWYVRARISTGIFCGPAPCREESAGYLRFLSRQSCSPGALVFLAIRRGNQPQSGYLLRRRFLRFAARYSSVCCGHSESRRAWQLSLARVKMPMQPGKAPAPLEMFINLRRMNNIGIQSVNTRRERPKLSLWGKIRSRI